MSEEELGAYCRTKGLYPEQIAQWKQACADANNWKQASEKELKQATQAERKKVKQLKEELGYHHKTEIFEGCRNMGQIVVANIQLLLQKDFKQSIL